MSDDEGLKMQSLTVKTRTRIALSLLLPLTFLTSFLIVSPPTPAMAAGPASITRDIGLALEGGTAYLGPRRIQLAAGTYWWDTAFRGYNDPMGQDWYASREMGLDAGWYNWSCIVTSTGNDVGDNYYTFCMLDPEAPGKATAYLPEAGQASLWGSYHWSSTLDRVF